jgi:hypothetical protein
MTIITTSALNRCRPPRNQISETGLQVEESRSRQIGAWPRVLRAAPHNFVGDLWSSRRPGNAVGPAFVRHIQTYVRSVGGPLNV